MNLLLSTVLSWPTCVTEINTMLPCLALNLLCMSIPLHGAHAARGGRAHAGKWNKHVDAWDAIKDNEFFSFEVSGPPGLFCAGFPCAPLLMVHPRSFALLS